MTSQLCGGYKEEGEIGEPLDFTEPTDWQDFFFSSFCVYHISLELKQNLISTQKFKYGKRGFFFFWQVNSHLFFIL